MSGKVACKGPVRHLVRMARLGVETVGTSVGIITGFYRVHITLLLILGPRCALCFAVCRQEGMHFPPGQSAFCRKEPAGEREVSDLPAPSLVEPGQKHPSAGLHGSRSGFISEQWLLRPALDLRLALCLA